MKIHFTNTAKVTTTTTTTSAMATVVNYVQITILSFLLLSLTATITRQYPNAPLTKLKLLPELKYVECFAAKSGGSRKKPSSRKNKNKPSITTGKGFSTHSKPSSSSSKYATVEEYARSLADDARLPPDADECECPCGTTGGSTYGECCGPFHRGEKRPESPLDVLKTRYTAFKWRLPLYIMDTTHSTCDDYRPNRMEWIKDLNRDGMFDSMEFMGLTHGPQTIGEDGREGFIDFAVEMKANGRNNGSGIEGDVITIRERSRFVCDEGDYWKYASGDVTSDVIGLEDVILNPKQ